MSYNSVEDYVKNAESNRNTAILNSLLESEPGMKELPEITPEDEGKILQVNNGEPSWSSGSSGGGVLEISVDNDTGALNKTWQEIHDALLSGKTCIVHEEFDNELIWEIVVCVSTDGSVYSVGVNNWTARTDSANGYPIAS